MTSADASVPPGLPRVFPDHLMALISSSSLFFF
jgi:hypothetical protein